MTYTHSDRLRHRQEINSTCATQSTLLHCTTEWLWH